MSNPSVLASLLVVLLGCGCADQEPAFVEIELGRDVWACENLAFRTGLTAGAEVLDGDREDFTWAAALAHRDSPPDSDFASLAYATMVVPDYVRLLRRLTCHKLSEGAKVYVRLAPGVEAEDFNLEPETFAIRMDPSESSPIFWIPRDAIQSWAETTQQ